MKEDVGKAAVVKGVTRQHGVSSACAYAKKVMEGEAEWDEEGELESEVENLAVLLTEDGLDIFPAELREKIRDGIWQGASPACKRFIEEFRCCSPTALPVVKRALLWAVAQGKSGSGSSSST